jgi:formylglycine-generating enzyme required for sulfatase activity
MSRTRRRCGRLAAALACAGLACAGQAEEFGIRSFDGTGRLSFSRVPTATVYRVEWAPKPAGPWTNFAGAASQLDNIAQFATGSYTCSVPMCYRVVASVTSAPPPVEEGDYLVVDLSGGPSAESYPVTYLDDVPGGGWTDEYKTAKLVLRRIPATATDFTMGSPTDELGRFSGETQHQVTLTSDFYLGVFEVTQRQWELVTGDKPSYFNNATYYESRPVEQVSYYDVRENPDNSAISPNWPASTQVHADSFMGKLRAKTGLSGFDLPTESQWEYACRAGTATALNSGYDLTSTSQDYRMDQVGRNFYNGDWNSSQGCEPSAGTATAGSYLPNAWGLYDMHGNVWEWCLDWYGTYPGIVTDPKGASSGSHRVIRGGSWINNANSCRSADRDDDPDGRSISIGFRACCAPPGQP